jgi:EpsI family protein
MAPVGQTGPVSIARPMPSNGWEHEDRIASAWVPDLEGPVAARAFEYSKGSHRVALFVAAYRHQTQAAQVGSSANQLARSDNARWKQTATGMATLDSDLDAVPRRVNTGELRDVRATERVVVLQWYWTGNGATASAARTKLELARARLARASDAALWIAVHTNAQEDRAAAERILQEFLRDMGPSLHQAFSSVVR